MDFEEMNQRAYDRKPEPDGLIYERPDGDASGEEEE